MHCGLLSRVAAAGFCLLLAGCGVGPRPQLPAAEPDEPDEQWASQHEQDQALVDAAELHVVLGQEQLRLGRLVEARGEFDRAVEILTAMPGGARTNEFLRDHFDRLVERIAASEAAFLGRSDGFAERPYETASIDHLLDASIFDSTPSAETERIVLEDMAAGRYDIPIPLNARVLHYVELFQGRLRSFLQDGLTRGTQYLPMIRSIFRAEGLPLDLAYLPLIESAYKPNALSRAQARGVWQFMAATGREQGLAQDWYVDERSDPERATYAAARYLKGLHRMFDGDWHLALASYNGGPGRVQRALRRSGRSDFWALSAATGLLPRETREYVPMILAAIIIARNPGAYDFEVDPLPPLDYDRLTVEQPVDLRRIAEWANTSVEHVQTLNPQLRRWTTPVRHAEFQLKLPPGTATSVASRLEDAPAEGIASLSWYTVRSGDTLGAIAQRLGVRTAELAAANELRTNARLHPGQELVVPQPPTTVTAARADQSAAAAGPPGQAAGMPSPVVRRHQVRRGDTLGAIARRYGTTVTQLRAWNNLHTNTIVVGQALTIHASGVTAGAAQTAQLVHQVRRGDTLGGIARLYRTSVADLRAWNNLPTTRIRAGDRLTVYTAAAEME